MPEIITVGQLPDPALNKNKEFLVMDSLTSGDCTIGGGNKRTVCMSNGTAWLASQTQFVPADPMYFENDQLKVHTEGFPTIEDLNNGLAGKADLMGGKILTSQLPAQSTGNPLGTFASEAAMLAVTTAINGDAAKIGDYGIRTDSPKRLCILAALPATTLSHWMFLDLSDLAGVTSWNGETGVIVAGKTDIGLSNVDNTSDINKPVSAAQAASILNAKNAADAAQTAADAANARAMTPGPQGAKGDTGNTGAQGSTGAAGASGAAGATGAKGDTGTTGSVGAAGAQGIQGATGLTGPTGSAGATGAQGPTGAAGTNGTNGSVGSTGATGSAGATGSTGAAGPSALGGTFTQTIALALGGSTSFTVTVTGATVGMVAIVNPIPNSTLLANLSAWRAAVTATNTVTIYLTAGIAILSGSQQFAVRVIQ